MPSTPLSILPRKSLVSTTTFLPAVLQPHITGTPRVLFCVWLHSAKHFEIHLGHCVCHSAFLVPAGEVFLCTNKLLHLPMQLLSGHLGCSLLLIINNKCSYLCLLHGHARALTSPLFWDRDPGTEASWRTDVLSFTRNCVPKPCPLLLSEGGRGGGTRRAQRSGLPMFFSVWPLPVWILGSGNTVVELRHLFVGLFRIKPKPVTSSHCALLWHFLPNGKSSPPMSLVNYVNREEM